MTDREMLELAALAAGVKLLFDPHGTPRDCTGAHPDANVFSMPVWNPLADGDAALRLAAHLGILLRRDFIRLLGDLLGSGVDYRDAHRLAIVRIAAKIGRLRQEQ